MGDAPISVDESAERVHGRPSPVPRGGVPAAPVEVPPPSAGGAWVRRTWWVPWALGAVAVGVAVVAFLPGDGGAGGPVELPISTHTVEYQIDGNGISPEIKYVVDGVAESETVESANLPWRKEITIEVGPAMGIAQVMATNTGTAPSITCRILVDGEVVHQAEAPGDFATVSCSSVLRPAAS